MDNNKAIAQALFKFNYEAALRNPTSTVGFANAFAGNGHDFSKSVIAGLACTGGKHAPIKECYELLSDIDCLVFYKKAPGFGSSFEKEDPLIEELHRAVIEIVPDSEIFAFDRLLNKVDQLFPDKGLRPNGALYNALCARAMGIPIEACEQPFIVARIGAWASLVPELMKELDQPKMEVVSVIDRKEWLNACVSDHTPRT